MPVEAETFVGIFHCLLSTMSVSLLAALFLLIHLQSGIHLFNIHSNTLELSQPCSSSRQLIMPALFSDERQTRQRGTGGDCAHRGMMICTL